MYKTVKPFMFAYDIPPERGASTNHIYTENVVNIQDAQGHFGDFSLDVHGFEFAEHQTQLSKSDFDNKGAIQEKYIPEILNLIEKTSPPGTQLRVMNFVQRKRGPDFPRTRQTAGAGLLNPVIMAHADYTQDGANVAIEDILQRSQHLQGHKFDIINIWRPINGPCVHWPLALCDFTSLDENDIETTDVIHVDHVGESVRLYANPTHSWHYLHNQTPDQVIIFRSVAMNDRSIPFGIHSAFARTEEDKTASARRDSIEVRIVRFFV